MIEELDDIRQRVALQSALTDRVIDGLGRATEALANAASASREVAGALATHRAASDTQHAATQGKIDGQRDSMLTIVGEAKGEHKRMGDAFERLRAEVAGLRSDFANERKLAREERATVWRILERALPYIIGAIGAGGGLYGWRASSTPTTSAADHAAP